MKLYKKIKAIIYNIYVTRCPNMIIYICFSVAREYVRIMSTIGTWLVHNINIEKRTCDEMKS